MGLYYNDSTGPIVYPLGGRVQYLKVMKIKIKGERRSKTCKLIPFSFDTPYGNYCYNSFRILPILPIWICSFKDQFQI